MTRIESFPPIAAKNAKILILGTMPGEASLKAQQYYAHPRNHFWRLMGALVNAGPDVSYNQRVKILKKNNIAVWDVLKCCVRPGSLDSAITEEIPNDFSAFFSAHPNITHVFFGSGKAEQSFKKHAAPLLKDLKLKYHRLPSPSPAHAALNFKQKLKAWERILI